MHSWAQVDLADRNEADARLGRPTVCDDSARSGVITMATMGSYDSTLQMFVQTPRDVDVRRLAFMRWLAEQGRLEHAVAGPSSGTFRAPTEVVSAAEAVAVA